MANYIEGGGHLEPTGEIRKDISPFPHNEVEPKWMNRWVDDKLYQAHDNTDKPKYYVLDMYPYPSGSGLHVGHVEGYTATDIVSRFKRMKGYEVLHPMGWDAFGLPTENYAISTGEDPHVVTARNADTFREQCIRTGFSIDWDREIDTSKEEYYKWTQSIFLDLFDKGLAYKAEVSANWCVGCQTVIANEQVQDACCERCSSPVESRNVEQWFFKITDYADRLIEDLDKVDWLESTKEGQKNWIGKTEGTELQVDLASGEEGLSIFMTQPELLYGASFIAIAPEHPDAHRLIMENRKSEALEYISSMTPQSEIERKKQKAGTGVFTGSFAINPLTGEQIPIWIADYMLMNDAGGIRAGVPAESEKDRDFALAHELQIVPVLELSENGSADRKILFGKYRGDTQLEARGKIIEELDNRAVPATKYNLRDWNISRERYWGAPIPIIHCDSCGDQPVPRDQLPVALPQIDDFRPTGIPPLAKSEEFLNVPCPHCNNPAQRETKTLDTFVDSAWYFMRFADPHNNDSIGDKDLLNKWLPVDYYVGGADHTAGHLLYARFITKVLFDLGRIDFDEPFKTLKHQGMILGPDGRKMSKRWGNTVNPLDVSNELGSDALRVYEMFMGPLDQSKVWDTQSITGSRRLIDRVWQMRQKVQVEVQATPEEKSRANILIENVTSAIESSRFNIAVSEFMKYINFVDESGKIDRQSYETFLKLLAPYAPFITEELWERAGNTYSIHQSSWPEPSQEGARARSPIPVMVNGKFRGTILPQEGLGESDEEIMAFLRTDEKLAGQLTNITARRIIYKQGKAINIVT